MSVLEEVLEEEYDRSVRMSRRIEAELAVLPKGSVRKREIRGHVYYYLNYREGDKVKSKYIPAADVEKIRLQLSRRKELIAAQKEQQRSRKQIERALGRRPHVE
ncbi:hypothetical protein [Enorma phocaeensis]|uniref:DUF6788 domain-containing protein n=1 Tax=Enorma phocaeensis TaxID=1871019 RepID=A0A921IV61_9ACTN|nr:hypothetical protein [Enorma phocaeensis]HJG36689.1 hypothetical protein [Enorma phocaeensis]